MISAYRPSTHESEEKTLLLLGATGTGKSTLVDALINFIAGVSYDDNHRFTLICKTDEEKENKQHESQTSSVTVYRIPRMPGLIVSCGVNIIDTPGFNDTRDDFDKNITEQVKELFQNKVTHLDAILIVVPLSTTRLTPGQQHVFSNILNMFGEDIQQNIFLAVTWDDLGELKCKAVLEAANIHVRDDGVFRFNNSIVLSEFKSDGAHTSNIDQEFWNARRKTFSMLFQKLETTPKMTETSSVEVMRARFSLEIQLVALEESICEQAQHIANYKQHKIVMGGTERDGSIRKTKAAKRRIVPKTYRQFNGKYSLNCDKCCKTSLHEIPDLKRFSKESIQILTNLLNDDLKRPTHRSHAIPVETQIKIAIRYYASGSFMQVIGDTFGYNKSTVSRIIQAVTGAICAHGADFLRWPDETYKPAIINGFYDIARFPCVIGAVDGTHIRIQGPSDNEYAFVNRKNFHSINVQGICDHEGKFTNIVAKWPGSTHDSFIFRNSDVGIHLDQNHRGFDVDGLLLEDSGYACKTYLMTPYLRPSTRQQERYNSAQSRTRSVIERTFGRWKRRFHLLHSEIRLIPDRVCKVIVACAILFNFAILQKEPMVDDREIEDVDVGQDLGHQNGMNIRNLIATTYF